VSTARSLLLLLAVPSLVVVLGGSDPAVYEVAVTRVFKGEVPARAEVVTSVSGASCGLELPAVGPALLFAREVDGELRGELCGGSRTGGGDPEVLGPGRPPGSRSGPPAALPAALPAADDDLLPLVAGGAVVAGLLLAGLAWRRRVRPGCAGTALPGAGPAAASSRTAWLPFVEPRSPVPGLAHGGLWSTGAYAGAYEVTDDDRGHRRVPPPPGEWPSTWPGRGTA
jgi:hypothetical protein